MPAHDESAVIVRTLTTLLGSGELGDVDLVIACNGCHDDTAELAGRTLTELGVKGSVLDLPTPSKTAAIRQAELLLGPGPRLYLDADVDCPGATAEALLRAVEGGAQVAVPRRVLDLRHASLPARHYHRFWADLPWVRDQLAGRGAYALSEGLREGLGEFPDVVADDRWATTRCPPEEAVILDEAVTIRPAGRLREVVRVRTRIYGANLDPAVPAHDRPRGSRARALAERLVDPRRWLGMGLFVAVAVAAKARATIRSRSGGRTSWGRDDSRGGVADDPPRR